MGRTTTTIWQRAQVASCLVILFDLNLGKVMCVSIHSVTVGEKCFLRYQSLCHFKMYFLNWYIDLWNFQSEIRKVISWINYSNASTDSTRLTSDQSTYFLDCYLDVPKEFWPSFQRFIAPSWFGVSNLFIFFTVVPRNSRLFPLLSFLYPLHTCLYAYYKFNTDYFLMGSSSCFV